MTRPTIDLSKYPNVWCPNCEEITPVRFNEMSKDALNDHAAADVVCSKCDFVIATFHAGRP